MKDQMKMDTAFRRIVAISIGEASMLWSEIPSGVFDDTKASELIDVIVRAAITEFKEKK